MEANDTAYEIRLLNTENRDVLGVEPRQIRLFRDPRGQIRLTLPDDRSYLQVKAMAGFPLTQPNAFIGLADGQNKQICMIENLEDLDPESRALVDLMLEVRYFVPRINRVMVAKDEFGVVRFHVETDRGQRLFHVRNLRDSMQELPDMDSLLTDVDGNRFILPDPSRLDRESRLLLLNVL